MLKMYVRDHLVRERESGEEEKGESWKELYVF